MKALYSLILLLLTLLFASCSKDSDEHVEEHDFATLYGGNPYKGTVIGTRSISGNDTHRWEGDARIVVMEATGDSASVVVMADFADVGEINLKIRGAYHRSSFYAEGEQVDFQINNQNIKGSIANQMQKIDLNGTLTSAHSDLVMVVEFLQGQDGFPPGSKLVMTFETSRNVNENTAGCTMRVVPIWGPSGMTMGMVPDC